DAGADHHHLTSRGRLGKAWVHGAGERGQQCRFQQTSTFYLHSGFSTKAHRSAHTAERSKNSARGRAVIKIFGIRRMAPDSNALSERDARLTLHLAHLRCAVVQTIALAKISLSRFTHFWCYYRNVLPFVEPVEIDAVLE